MIKTVRPLAALATLLLAVPAFAQPGVEDPPMQAGTVVIVTPQSPVIAQPAGPGQMIPGVPLPPPAGWSNINGQLVKVGEHGDYLYNNGKTTNIATNPIGWMFGFYGLSVSHAVHPNVAIRGDVNWFKFDGQSGHEVGVSAPIYFRRVFDGPFLELGLIARNMRDSCSDCDAGSESVGPEVLFGWHWTFDSGLNVAMAFGAMRNMNGSNAVNSNPTEPAGYFRVGYAF